MRLDALELAERDTRERRVLTVGGEHPRVVREAGADPGRAPDHALGRRVLLAFVREPDLQVLGALGEIGDVLLAPVDRSGELRVARQRDLRPARERVTRR